MMDPCQQIVYPSLTQSQITTFHKLSEQHIGKGQTEIPNTKLFYYSKEFVLMTSDIILFGASQKLTGFTF